MNIILRSLVWLDGLFKEGPYNLWASGQFVTGCQWTQGATDAYMKATIGPLLVYPWRDVPPWFVEVLQAKGDLCTFPAIFTAREVTGTGVAP